MRTRPIEPADLRGVFAVPPLARNHDARRTLNWAANDKIASHIQSGGVTRLLYGGNAFLYHITLSEYEELLDWLVSRPDDLWCIPSAGPSYGRLMDQAPLLRRHPFPTVMHLPSGDPRDAEGLEAGLTDFADAVGKPLILYLKEENNFGSDRDRGLDAIARLVDKGICIAIKYAVVRPDPAVDPCLDQLLARVDRSVVVSGIGERPAITHMQAFGLQGYTTGSGCIGSALTQTMYGLCAAGRFHEAADLRRHFLPLEDLRDAWGPARVLHAATEVAGIAPCGPVPPFITALSEERKQQLREPAVSLLQERSQEKSGSNSARELTTSLSAL